MHTIRKTVEIVLAGGTGAATKTKRVSGFRGRLVSAGTIYATSQHANLVATVTNKSNGQLLFSKTGATQGVNNVRVQGQQPDGTAITGIWEPPYVSEGDVLEFKGVTGNNGSVKFELTFLVDAYETIVTSDVASS